MKTIFILVLFSLLSSSICNVCSNLVFTATSPKFSDNDFATMKSYFLQNINIQGKGGIVASPDLKTPVGGGNYSYDWERDGSITMRAFMQINGFDLSVITSNMESYIQWVLRVQNENDPFGFDVRVEPKYNLPNGDVYTGGWGRPQTDGPGLRASTLILYANALLKNGKSDYILSYLWTKDDNKYHGGAIKYDLDWIINHWSTTTGFDPWEDLQDLNIFWNKMHQRKALVYGAQFATAMGDTSMAQKYTQVAADIESSILTHWNGNLFQETTSRPKDGAVLCAFNLGYADDEFLKPTDVRIAQTVSVLNDLFCSSFPINNQDTKNNVPGILYGRYDGDVYQNGNPWVLISANLATLFYRGAGYINAKKSSMSQVISDSEYSAWQKAINLQTTQSFLSSTDRDAALATSFIQAGDAVLQRIYYHVAGDNFHLAEQFDKNSGYQISAKDLTWSYADVLVALNTRKEVLASIGSFATE